MLQCAWIVGKKSRVAALSPHWIDEKRGESVFTNSKRATSASFCRKDFEISPTKARLFSLEAFPNSPL